MLPRSILISPFSTTTGAKNSNLPVLRNPYSRNSVEAESEILADAVH